MPEIVEIRPIPSPGGYYLKVGAREIWFDSEVHAISYGQDYCADCDILIYDSAGHL